MDHRTAQRIAQAKQAKAQRYKRALFDIKQAQHERDLAALQPSPPPPKQP